MDRPGSQRAPSQDTERHSVHWVRQLGVNKRRMRRQLHMPQAKKDADRPGSQRRRNGKFRGMVLERLGGRTLDVELAARRSGLQDVHFIWEVLFQVWRLWDRNLVEWVFNLCSVCDERAARGYCPCESSSQSHTHVRRKSGDTSLCGRATWCNTLSACPDSSAGRPESRSLGGRQNGSSCCCQLVC